MLGAQQPNARNFPRANENPLISKITNLKNNLESRARFNKQAELLELAVHKRLDCHTPCCIVTLSFGNDAFEVHVLINHSNTTSMHAAHRPEKFEHSTRYHDS